MAVYDEDGQGDLRFHLWAEAFNKGMGAAMLGLGPGPHLTQKVWKLSPPAKFEAHNTPLDLFAQGGLLALLAVAWLYASLLLATTRAKLPALAALSCAFVVFSMFHFIIRHPIFWFGSRPLLLGSRLRLEALVWWKTRGWSSAMTIESNGGHEAMNTRQATGLHVRQLINLLRRRWKLIIIAAGLAVGLAGTIGLVFPPRYTAIAQVMVDPPRGISGAGEPSTAGVLDDAAVQTHVAALLSQSHLQRVFDSLVKERGPGPKERQGVVLGAKSSLSILSRTALTRSRTLTRE